MNEEILRVLEMVKSGRITAEEGEKLISAMSGEGEKKSSGTGIKNTMLRIRVDVADPEKKEQVKVNVNVPLLLAKKAAGLLSLVPKDAKAELIEKGIDLDAIDLAELISLFEEGAISENLVDVQAGDSEQGATVKVYVD